MRRPLPTLLAVLVILLSACSRGDTNASSALMLAVAGSHDRAADTRERLPSRLRRAATWTRDVPIPARALRVTYDTDQRTTAWRADITGSGLAPRDLLGARTLRSLGRVAGADVSEVEGGPFEDSLALVTSDRVTVLSKAYALRYEPDLLPLLR